MPRVCVLRRWQIIPDHAQYRKDVEAISGYRLKVAMETEDVRDREGQRRRTPVLMQVGGRGRLRFHNLVYLQTWFVFAAAVFCLYFYSSDDRFASII